MSTAYAGVTVLTQNLLESTLTSATSNIAIHRLAWLITVLTLKLNTTNSLRVSVGNKPVPVTIYQSVLKVPVLFVYRNDLDYLSHFVIP